MSSSSQPSQAPFSLRPLQPPNDRNPKDLSEFIGRLNAQPGGFRNVRQAGLQRQVQGKRRKLSHDNNGDDVRMYDGEAEEEDDEATETEAAKDLAAARNNVARNIEMAYFNVKQTLDFVSLWMSKERPTQVMGTLDNQLRQLVGIGTIGSTKLHEPSNREKKEDDNLLTSTGSKLLSINRSASTLMAAAARLQKESSVESKYWKDVIEVKECGWPVARLPNDPHTLAVKFGFSETNIPEFDSNSWAAMRRADDGSATLDTGRLASEPKRVVVSLKKDGKVFGRSSLAKLTPDDATIEERVREARNTILAQELWHEINREGRTLLAHNVQLKPGSVVYSVDEHITIQFALVTLGDESEASSGTSTSPSSRTGDAYAETICLGLYLLLAHAHRQAAKKRSQLMPLSTDQVSTIRPPYSLIKPIISYLQHELWLRSTMQFLSSLCAILRLAGIKTARYTLQEHVFPLVPLEGASDQLLTVLLSRLGYRFELTVTPQARFEIIGVGHVVMSQATSAFFRIALLPPLNPEQPAIQPDVGSHPLHNRFPPADQYPTTWDAFHYLGEATKCVLAKHYEGLAAEWTAKGAQNDAFPSSAWLTTIRGDAISDRETDTLGVRFLLLSEHDTTRQKIPLAPPVTELRIETNGSHGAKTFSWKYHESDSIQANRTTLDDAVHHILMDTGSTEAA